MRKAVSVLAVLMLVLTVGGTASALVWGVNPGAANELENLDPFSGVINTSYDLSGLGIGSSNTEIGLAGWSNALYYTNANVANGRIYVLNPSDGSTTTSYAVSGGWEIDGLGYWSGAAGSYLYTSGCSVDDVHRYVAADGSSPYFYWSNVGDPRSIAGDNGGRIFTYGAVGSTWGIWEMDPLSDVAATWFASSPSTSVVGMAYDGTYLYLSDLSGYLYTMNNAGQVVNRLCLGYTLYALASTEGVPTNVPEPGTMFLVISGLIGLAGLRRKM